VDTSARSLEAYGFSYISWYSLLVLVLGSGTSGGSSLCSNVSYVSPSRFAETPVKLPSRVAYFETGTSASLVVLTHNRRDSISLFGYSIARCPSALYHESLTQSSLTIMDSFCHLSHAIGDNILG